MEEISLNLELGFRLRSQCHYRPLDHQYGYDAIIRGSLREGAATPAHIIVYADEFISHVGLADVKPEGVTKKNDDFAPIYADDPYCDWGDCVSRYTRIGRAAGIEIK